MKKFKLGYTQGVYDMFHIGHLNLLLNAKAQCEQLVVGVNADVLVESYKHKTPVIDEESRRTIVENIKPVDSCIIARTLDKLEMHKLVNFDVIFIGSDWKGDLRWVETEKQLAMVGAEVFYLPYTEGICSTGLRKIMEKKVSE